MARRDLPSGTVTLVFTDIEGSTKLLHLLGAERYAEALAQHRRILRESFVRFGGVEIDTQGDAFFYAFQSAQGAVDAACEGTAALAEGPIRVRIGIHTGTPTITDEGYVGHDVHRGARIAAAGHGGQILLSAATRSVIDGSVTDLGEHRLKDFDVPVAIFQIGTDRFPPLKTISNTNLPRPASSFVGRRQEVSDLSVLLDENRLVTLTGPGGSGKSRLAIEIAADRVHRMRNGVFWVPLASVLGAADVPGEIAAVLGARDDLAGHIGEREMLLLIDNFEQVIGAAAFLQHLLESCSRLRLIVTSREVLRIDGEVEYQVLPLETSDAVQLFCARARCEPDEIVVELCARLDNLPLAIELAAARTNVLDPADILERLSARLDLLKAGRGAEPRQATLRSTIEWSYDLLTSTEQILFARLAVFAGGCTLASAEPVANADLDDLGSLVNKSLLRREEKRFWMLQTIREFAAEQLARSAEVGDIRRRHAEHYLMFALEAEPFIETFVPEWMERLQTEHDNLRAALDFFEDATDEKRLVRMSGALSDFWYYGRHVAEGSRRLKRALSKNDEPSPARAKALSGAGGLAAAAGNIGEAVELHHQALDLYRALRDERGVAYTSWSLGAALVNDERASEALPLIQEAVAIFERLGDERYLVAATRALGWAHFVLGDLERARAVHEQNLARARRIGFTELETGILGSLTMLALRQERREDARKLAKENLELSLKLGSVMESEIDLSRAGRVLAALGRCREAAEVLGCAAAVRAELKVAEPWVVEMHDRAIADARARLDPDEFVAAFQRGSVVSAEEGLRRALAFLEPTSS